MFFRFRGTRNVVPTIPFGGSNNPTYDQMKLLSIRRKIVNTGSVDTVKVLDPEESNFHRAWIPESITTLTMKCFEVKVCSQFCVSAEANRPRI
jgi:hypothetical protein